MDRVASRRGACVVAVVLLAGWMAGASSALASGWSIQRSPSPPRVENGGLGGGVSCVSSSDCVAVGSYVNRADISAPLAERWNGVSWSIQPTPSPSGSTYGELLSVSCAAATACTAVGDYNSNRGTQPLAEQWNGSSWSIQPTPNPGSGILSSVSCTSPTACSAVGSAGLGTPLVERWDGTSWSVQPTPQPAAKSSLIGVSCTSATACTAVGGAGEYSPDDTPLVERWDGSTWSVQPSPTIAGDLDSVSCSSTTSCTAVGHHCSCQPDTPLVEHWDGTSWSVQSTPQIPRPPNANVAPDVNLVEVSCTSSTACTAAGFYNAFAAGGSGTLVERWDGTTWSIQPTPNPADAALRGVSCASPTACTAVGDYQDPAGGQATLAVGLNQTGWSIETTPNPAGPVRSQLTGVSCASTTGCVAVGTGGGLYPGEGSLVERWNRGKWSVLPAPDSTGTAVSCVSPTACTVVGGQQAERWNGRRWSVRQMPHLAGPLDSVSCTSRTACTAVAAFSCTDCLPPIPHEVPIAARWSGASWSVELMPTAYMLQGLSCASPSACTAVGEGGGVERWNGRRWSIRTIPAPNGVTDFRLNGVSCVSPRACTAVGTVYGYTHGLVERWNGIKWSIEATPHPRGANAASLTGISCTALNTCTAVGSYTTPNGRERLLVESWNGRRWAIHPTPSPAAATSSALTSVSCPSPTVCTAVGWYDNAPGDELTLVERWNASR
jgi:hypothetical protein